MGIKEAASFPDMTPREVFLILTAHRSLLDQKWRDAVILSRLIALSVHDPAHLPAVPASSPTEMTADQMKRALLSLTEEEEKNDP